MDTLSIITLGIALSLDTFAVCIVCGASLRALPFRKLIAIPFLFAIFHAFMPFLGWAIGLRFQMYIQDYDHWVALGLLWALGIKMIYESRSMKEGEEKKIAMKFASLITLAIATSIDALAVGITFAFLQMDIVPPLCIISSIVLFVSCVALWIGRRFNTRGSNKIELVGGIILIVIGVQIVIEHVFFT